jgi:hypothetical protein
MGKNRYTRGSLRDLPAGPASGRADPSLASDMEYGQLAT